MHSVGCFPTAARQIPSVKKAVQARQRHPPEPSVKLAAYGALIPSFQSQQPKLFPS